MSVASLAIVLVGAGYFSVSAERLSEAAAAPEPYPQSTPTAAAPQAATPPRALVTQYCVTCHNERLKTGGLALDTVDVDHPELAPDVWEKVAHKLRTGDMPPTGRPRPDLATSTGLAEWLEDRLDRAAASRPNAGNVPPHRLNRAEYANAIRDLLGLEISPTILPADGSLLGFDNMAGVLSVSPMLLERYINVARQISRFAVGDSTINVAPVTYMIDGATRQDDRNEDLPFGARGVTVRHYFPLDGTYVVQVRLRRNSNEYIRGLGRRPQPLEIRLDGVRLARFGEAGLMKGMPPPETYTQNDLGDPDWEKSALDGDAGFEAQFQAKAGMRVVAVALEADRWEADELLMPITGSANRNAEDRDGSIAVATVTVSGPQQPLAGADALSRRRIFVCQPGAGVAERESCARTILTRLARLAYRRPLVDKDVEPLMAFCRAGIGEGFDRCIQMGLERILASPHFLFRIDGSPENATAAGAQQPVVTLPPALQRLPSVLLSPSRALGSFTTLAQDAQADVTSRVSDLQLASRLSFFLWSSIPDDELLRLAEQGKLAQPAVLQQQVQRMLSDSRSRSLIENFVGQWLELRRLDGVAPVEDIFPEFDTELRDAFKQETERFVDSMMREDRPVVDLLTANYTFLNERLARHYGIPNLLGSHFRRVTLADDTRAGLLGQGSILTLTSQANRTSPVLRGKWVLDNILGAPVPPPPPDVPALKPSDAKGAPLTGRAALEQHRTLATCANCHARMDPWGFALENFNGVGAWRSKDGNAAINSSDVLLDGTRIDGPAGVRSALLARREQFVQTVIEKLMVYALGRPLEYYDRPALRKIVKDAAANQNRWSSIFQGIVSSTPFQFQTKGAV
jgi:cytochrome c553